MLTNVQDAYVQNCEDIAEYTADIAAQLSDGMFQVLITCTKHSLIPTGCRSPGRLTCAAATVRILAPPTTRDVPPSRYLG